MSSYEVILPAKPPYRRKWEKRRPLVPTAQFVTRALEKIFPVLWCLHAVDSLQRSDRVSRKLFTGRYAAGTGWSPLVVTQHITGKDTASGWKDLAEQGEHPGIPVSVPLTARHCLSILKELTWTHGCR